MEIPGVLAGPLLQLYYWAIEHQLGPTIPGWAQLGAVSIASSLAYRAARRVGRFALASRYLSLSWAALLAFYGPLATGSPWVPLIASVLQIAALAIVDALLVGLSGRRSTKLSAAETPCIVVLGWLIAGLRHPNGMLTPAVLDDLGFVLTILSFTWMLLLVWRIGSLSASWGGRLRFLLMTAVLLPYGLFEFVYTLRANAIQLGDPEMTTAIDLIVGWGFAFGKVAYTYLFLSALRDAESIFSTGNGPPANTRSLQHIAYTASVTRAWVALYPPR